MGQGSGGYGGVAMVDRTRFSFLALSGFIRGLREIKGRPGKMEELCLWF